MKHAYAMTPYPDSTISHKIPSRVERAEMTLLDLALKVLTLYQIGNFVIIVIALLLVTTFLLLQVLVRLGETT